MWLGGSGALIFAIHNLTALFYALCAVMVFVVAFSISDERRKLTLNALWAACIAFCLSSVSFAAFYEIGIKNTIVTPQRNLDPNSFTMKLSLGSADLKSYGLIISVLIVLQLSYFILNHSSMKVSKKSTNVIGFIFLILSSSIVPWNSIFARISFLQVLQFAYRLAPFALLLILTSFASQMNRYFDGQSENKRIIGSLLLGIALMSVAMAYNSIDSQAQAERLVSERIQNSFNVAFQHSDHLDKNLFSVTAPDYLPARNHVSFDVALSEYKDQVLRSRMHVKKSVNKRGALVFSWNQTAPKRTVRLLLIVYKQSMVKLNGRSFKASTIKRTRIGVPIVKPKEGKNTVEITFSKTKVFYFAEWLNILALTVFLIYCLICGYAGFRKYFSVNIPST